MKVRDGRECTLKKKGFTLILDYERITSESQEKNSVDEKIDVFE